MTRPPTLLDVPATSWVVGYLPAVVLHGGPDTGDAYDSRGSALVKVFPVKTGYRTARIGVRQGHQRCEATLDPAGLRALAAAATAAADMIDPPQPEPSPL